MVLGDNRGTGWSVDRWHSTHILVSSPSSIIRSCVWVDSRRRELTWRGRYVFRLWWITVVGVDLSTGLLTRWWTSIICRVVVLARWEPGVWWRGKAIGRRVVILLIPSGWNSRWRWA